MLYPVWKWQKAKYGKWTWEEFDTHLERIMSNIHNICFTYSEKYHALGHNVVYGSITRLVKVAEAISDQVSG